MDIRHLRCFVALAEELHFARAADRLHMESSPLSRIIKELEESVGVRLFDRKRQGTHLTQAGAVLLKDVRRIFIALEQAKQTAVRIASGHTGSLRLAVSDGVMQPRFSALLALCREEDPLVEIRLTEVSLTEQLRGLRDGTFDAGLARFGKIPVNEGIKSYALWQETLVVVAPSRHPLLVFPSIPVSELVKYPMIVSHPETCEGYSDRIEYILSRVEARANIAEETVSLETMLTLVAAGYGVGFTFAEKVAIYRYPEVVVRPLAIKDAKMTTYLLAKAGVDKSEQLDAFIDRATRESQCSNSQS